MLKKVLELYLQEVPDKKTKRHYLAYVAVTYIIIGSCGLCSGECRKPVGEFLYI